MTAMWLISLCAIILSLVSLNIGDGIENLFIFPTAPGLSDNFVGDLLWATGSIQNIQWSINLDAYNVSLYQQVIQPAGAIFVGSIYTVDSNGSGQQSYEWVVQTYNANLSISPVYFFWLEPRPPGFTSHYFNITSQAQSSSASTTSISTLSAWTSSSSILSTSTLSSSTDSTALPSSSSTSAPTSPKIADTASTSPSGIRPSTDIVKVGLGVGLGVGIPLALTAGIWIGLKFVKQWRSSSHGIASSLLPSQSADMSYTPKLYCPPNETKYNREMILGAPQTSNEASRENASGERMLFELSSRGS